MNLQWCIRPASMSENQCTPQCCEKMRCCISFFLHRAFQWRATTSTHFTSCVWPLMFLQRERTVFRQRFVFGGRTCQNPMASNCTRGEQNSVQRFAMCAISFINHCSPQGVVLFSVGKRKCFLTVIHHAFAGDPVFFWGRRGKIDQQCNVIWFLRCVILCFANQG